MNKLLLSFVLCCALNEVLSKVPLPDYIHPCAELSDECLTQATRDAIPMFVKGIPEANIPVLDPLKMDENVSMSLPGNLQMTFHNGKLLGLRTCVPNKVSSHRETRTFIFDMNCNLTIKGRYSLRGRFLLFNLDTEGDAKIKIVKQHIRLEVFQKVVKTENGEVHYNIQSYKHKADYGEDLKLNLTNLFRQSPELSATVLQLINANSKQLAGEFGGPILKYAIDYSMNVTQKFFDAYTYDQLVHVPLPDNFFNSEK